MLLRSVKKREEERKAPTASRVCPMCKTVISVMSGARFLTCNECGNQWKFIPPTLAQELDGMK